MYPFRLSDFISNFNYFYKKKIKSLPFRLSVYAIFPDFVLLIVDALPDSIVKILLVENGGSI